MVVFMPKMIFVNLPVTDLPRARAFYEATGFTINEMFSDETAACAVMSEEIFVMLLTHPKMKDFTTLPIGDAKQSVQHMLATNCDSRADVDALIEKAVKAGGTETRPVQDLGFMYSRAYADPDGHIWEPFWMDPAAAAGGPPAD